MPMMLEKGGILAVRPIADFIPLTSSPPSIPADRWPVVIVILQTSETIDTLPLITSKHKNKD